MPQKRAAYKEIRKSQRKHKRNLKVLSEIKTLTKNLNARIGEKKLDQAKELLRTFSSRMHKARAKGIIRRNTASRIISRLSKKLHKAASPR